MKTLRSSLFIALGLGALSSVASANGFFLNEHDAVQTGRAGASVASDTEASAIVFNPGGIPVGEGTSIQIGGSVIVAKATYNDPSNTGTDNTDSPAILPAMFVTSRLNEMFAVGLGFHAPFGLALTWPETSPQASVSLSSALRTYFITPAVGVNLKKFVPGLTFGAGLDLVPATVELKQAIVFGDTRGTAQLGGTAFGIGGRAGVQYVPEALKALKLGLTYKSQVNLDFKGDGDFDIADPFRSQLPADGKISTTVKLPMSLGVGAAYSPVENLELELDAVWINWSKFKEIDITLPDMTHQVRAQDYSDTVTIRVGAEYKLPAQHAAVRVGYIYDPTPVPTSTISATLPDANRNDVTVGGSYSFGAYDLSLALLAVLPSKATADATVYQPVFKGSYEVSAFVASLSLQTRFGGGPPAPAKTGDGTITRR
jgi:long-chain fatty acid transport protein